MFGEDKGYKKKEGRKLESWEKEREQYFKNRGLELESWQRLEMKGGGKFKELEKKT